MARAFVSAGVLAAMLHGAGALGIQRLDARQRACADGEGVSFPEFVRKHNRSYADDPQEYALRAKLFEARVEAVRSHNCAKEEELTPRRLWTAKVNHFADWTDSELVGLRGVSVQAWSHTTAAANLMGQRELPDTISYANLSTIQEPLDQGHCGSCWAFSATTAIRARAELHGLPHSLSVGQVVACAPNPNECGGQGGCQGATTELAYEYAMQTGLVHESRLQYPEHGGQPVCPRKLRLSDHSNSHLTPDGLEEHTRAGKARKAGLARRMGMTGWTKLPVNREEPIILALMDSGPLTVSVAASLEWHYYNSGIMPATGCDPDNVIGHAVVLFGIGTERWPDEAPVRYWSLKNSWGGGWGEGGNLRLQRADGEERMCGWDSKPEVGDGCRGGPEKVYVCGSCGILYNAAMPVFGSQKR